MLGSTPTSRANYMNMNMILTTYITWALLLLLAVVWRMGSKRGIKLMTLRVLIVWMLASPFLFFALILGLLERKKGDRNRKTEVVG